MGEVWSDIREWVKQHHYDHMNMIEPYKVGNLLIDADALLAVVKVTQISLGMSVPELLRIVAKDIATDGGTEAVDVLAMWLRRIADELERTLAALPEHLK